MAIFTLEEAARFSGRSPREVRLLIERGEIPGTQRGGRWTVTSHDLERTLSARTRQDVVSHPPVGAEPPDPFAPAAHPDRTLDRDARIMERVRGIERELAEMRARLQEASSKVAALGGDTPAPAGLQDDSAEGPDDAAGGRGESASGPGDSAVRQDDSGGPQAEGEEERGMREALTPLFRSERHRPGDAGREGRPSERPTLDD